MAACHTGIKIFALPAPSRIVYLQSRLQFLQTTSRVQNFHTAFRLNYAPKSGAKSKPSPSAALKSSRDASPTPIFSAGRSGKSGQLSRAAQILQPSRIGDSGLRATLANTKTPLVIYEAPPSRMNTVHLNVLALALAGCAVYFAEYGFQHPPEGLWWPVPWVYAATSLLMMVFATVMYTATIGRVLRITALPGRTLTASGLPGLRLRLRIVRWVPFYRFDVVVPAERVSVLKRLQDVRLRVSYREPLESVPRLIRPFVRFGDWVRGLFGELFGAINREQSVWLVVKGKYSLKLDVRGKALGGAKGFDSVIRLPQG